ncbi:hypothetical protein NGRRMQZB_23 [Escherichia phage Dru_SM1]
MKDLTMKFKDKKAFEDFLVVIDWEGNETLQNQIMLDVIGYTYTEVESLSDEPTYIQNEGYYVNVRVIDDSFDFTQYSNHSVIFDQPLREWA